MHAGGLPRIVASFCSGFLLLVELPRVLLVIFCKFFGEFFVADSSIILTKIGQKTIPGRSRRLPKRSQNAFRHIRRTTSTFYRLKVLTSVYVLAIFWSTWGRPGTQKFSKIGKEIFFGPPRRVRERSQIGFLTVGGAKPVLTRFLIDFWTLRTLTKHRAWQQI